MNQTAFTKLAMRFWIALMSLFSFLAGWIMLAHSPKPVQSNLSSSGSPAVQIGPAPTLPPLPPLDLSGNASSGGGPLPQMSFRQPSQTFGQIPMFTTGGS